MFTLPAPAKLNLFLHIVGRRDDGYHELQTVFQFLDITDTLQFRLRNDGEIHLHTDLDFPAEQNLVWRAAKLLQQHTNTKQGADITLQKRIPLGAGMGGGSSDAATTLVGLNRLWHTGLSSAALEKLGKQLGADVPIFVRGQASWAEGIGEQLMPVDCPERYYLVVVPPCQVSTQEVFSHPALTRNTPRIKVSDFLFHPAKTHNDFESLVAKLYPPVAAALQWLQQFATPRLTGSGSAIFAEFADPAMAKCILKQLPTPNCGFVTKAINRSPLLLELDNIATRVS